MKKTLLLLTALFLLSSCSTVETAETPTASSCEMVFEWLDYFYLTYDAQEIEMASVYTCAVNNELSSAIESTTEYEILELIALPEHPNYEKITQSQDEGFIPHFLVLPSESFVYDLINNQAGLKEDGVYTLLNTSESINFINEIDPQLSLLLY